MSEAFDLARVRHDNALRLFDEFVQANVRSADAATLRGLERRFAERLQIQPSYWSQIKGRSRQIGERLARQFEQLSRKPAGWMDQRHDHPPAPGSEPVRTGGGFGAAVAASVTLPHSPEAASPSQPQDDDERFIVGLVLTYYRRHPQRARGRLLDLLGEVLNPVESDPTPQARAQRLSGSATSAVPKPAPAPPASAAAAVTDDLALWQRSQQGVSPLPRKR